MEYVYTALLLHSTGKKVNEANVKKVIEASGAKADEAKIKALVSSLEGVNIEEVMKQSVIPVAAPQPAKQEKSGEKKQEVTPEQKEKKVEEAATGLASLFG